MQVYDIHVKKLSANLHDVLVQEGWASLAGEFEDFEEGKFVEWGRSLRHAKLLGGCQCHPISLWGSQ